MINDYFNGKKLPKEDLLPIVPITKANVDKWDRRMYLLARVPAERRRVCRRKSGRRRPRLERVAAQFTWNAFRPRTARKAATSTLSRERGVMAREIISVDRLSKSYAGVVALRDVSFSLAAGEIRAICGENGAGKSTFVKLLMGITQPDSGSISIDGRVRTIVGPQRAQGLGLGFVAQELSLAPRLSILDNIWLGSADVPLIHRRPRFRARAQEAMQLLGIGDWDLDRPVATLAIGQQQLVEIARLLARQARVLILDEPTATLTDAEIARILGVLKLVKARGHSIIYISHRLGEVFELCDSVSVFRNGEHVATKPVGEITRDGLIELMLGRSFGEMYPSAAGHRRAGSAIVVERLNVPDAVLRLFLYRAERQDLMYCRADRIGCEHGDPRPCGSRVRGHRTRDRQRQTDAPRLRAALRVSQCPVPVRGSRGRGDFPSDEGDWTTSSRPALVRMRASAF